MIAIEIESLTKKYGKVNALDGLNLEVKQGSVFGFLGPNGAGKTTTLRILAGLATPNGGRVSIFGGRCSNKLPVPSKDIGYLPEDPAFYPWMTPLEYLHYIGQIFNIDKNTRSLRTMELLTLTGLSEVSRRHIGGFSRGMRQRLGLAQALIGEPKILLLDEPVSALDPSGRKEILELIAGLGKERTVLMSSHILADVEKVCDTIGVINKGKLVKQSLKLDLMNTYVNPTLELEVGSDMVQQILEWKQRFEKMANVTGVSTEGATLRISVRDVRLAQSEILQELLSKKASFDRFEVVKPSLEDVFLQLINGKEARA
ncbi:MAG: ABC transporter ATP-binding protein [Chloroflexi bacterium]|nr:ABC transporter ATP-binding protein [Chloroflexota bacterium]